MKQHEITGENKRIADSLRYIADRIDRGLISGEPLQLVALLEDRSGETIVSVNDGDRMSVFTQRHMGHRAWILKDPSGPGIEKWIVEELQQSA